MSEGSAIAMLEHGEREADEQVHLVARSQQEMTMCRNSLAAWLTKKVGSMRVEAASLDEAAGIAATNGWALEALQRQARLAVKRTEYYEKLLAAVRAGYTIVPNIPVDLFAVRVIRKPGMRMATSTFGSANISDVQPQVLAEGEGKYVSATPLQTTWTHTEPDPHNAGKTREVHHAEFSEFSEVAFPLQSARPMVMEATQEAMAMKLFDAIGIAPSTNTRSADPMIVGWVVDPRPIKVWNGARSDRRHVSFLVAWHLDMTTL
jgi:hypothetical protein